jgi:hypothetical protein
MVPQYTDGTPIMSPDYCSDLERCYHKDDWTRWIRAEELRCTTYS